MPRRVAPRHGISPRESKLITYVDYGNKLFDKIANFFVKISATKRHIVEEGENLKNYLENRRLIMNSENQKQQIGNSLKTITEVFRSCNANYRILGSTLLVAHTNRVFRHINDVDVLLDIKAKDCVFEKLKNYGFELDRKTKAGFSWFEAKKNRYLGLTFLLIGEFEKNYFRWRFMNFFELRIKADYLRPTEYSFENEKFIGIPISSAIAGIRQSFLNPKRKLDKQVLGEEMNKTKVKTYNNISVYIFGFELPYLYDLFSFFYNIYGGIRVMFGRKYEIWD